MRRHRENLKRFLAESALKESMVNIFIRKEKDDKIEKFLLQNLVVENYKKIYLKLQRQKINRRIVEIVLNDLPIIKRNFIIYRYKKCESIKKISCSLNVSAAQLHEWNAAILSEIAELLEYKLTEKDIYSKSKIISMIEIIELRTKLAENEHFQKMLNPHWINMLTARRKKYRLLLQKIIECENRHDMYSLIVAKKVEHPDAEIKQIAAKCMVCSSAVSRSLKKFKLSVKKYVD
jgi:hypothetical protein